MAALCVGLSACQRSAGHYLERGKQLLAERKYEEAALNLKKAVQQDPSLAEAHFRLGQAESAQNHINDAHTAFTQAARLSPEREDMQQALADLALDAYLLNAAHPEVFYRQLMEISDRMLQQDPRSFQGLRIKGAVAMTERKLPVAIDYFRRAQEVKPFQPELVLLYSQALIQAGQVGEGEELARQLLERQKTFSPIYDVLYRRYRETGRLPEAERLLEERVKANPEQPASWVQLAEHRRTQGRSQEADLVVRGMAQRLAQVADARLMAGDYFRSSGNAAEAIQQYQAGAEAHPVMQSIYRKRALETLVQSGRHTEAVQEAGRLLQQQPRDAVVLAERAAARLARNQEGDMDAAVADLRAAAQLQPDDVELRQKLAVAELGRGKLDAARKEAQQILRAQPDAVSGKLLLAQLALAENNYAETCRHAEEVLALQPDNATAKFLQVKGLMGTGKLDEAKRELDRLLKRFPESRDAHLQLGLLYLAQKRYREAEAEFRRYSDGQQQGDLRPVEGLAKAYAAQQKFDEAIQVWVAQVSQSPNAIAPRIGLVQTALMAGRGDLALSEAEKLAAAHPDDARVNGLLGQVYFVNGRPDQALATYAKAAQLAPRDQQVLRMLAYLHLAKGNLAEAERTYRQILQYDPTNSEVLNNLAFALSQSGKNLEEATALAQRARQQQPGNPEFADTLACILLKRKMTDSAGRILSNLVKEKPGNPAYRYHLALVLIQQGQKVKAKEELQTALANRPVPQDEQAIKTLLSTL